MLHTVDCATVFGGIYIGRNKIIIFPKIEKIKSFENILENIGVGIGTFTLLVLELEFTNLPKI